MLKLVASICLLLLTQSYLIELELSPSEKSCISELFLAGEPISVVGLMHDKPQNERFSAYLTIETEKGRVLIHKQIDLESNTTKVIYNNEKDRTLNICVDNFEDFTAFIELEVKSKSDHTIHEYAANKGEYQVLDEIIIEATNIIDQSYIYFKQNEEYSGKILEMTGAFESKMTTTSLITLGVTIIIGLVQVSIIKSDLKAKKLF